MADIPPISSESTHEVHVQFHPGFLIPDFQPHTRTPPYEHGVGFKNTQKAFLNTSSSYSLNSLKKRGKTFTTHSAEK